MAHETNDNLTKERASELLKYNPDDGTLRWKKCSKPVSTGAKAGYIHDSYPKVEGVCGKYRVVGIDGKYYKAHRIAFLLMEDRFPEQEIDHIDGDGTNNGWSNLREVERQENAKNSRLPSSNTSGVIGVSWDSTYEKWSAEIRSNGEKEWLGYFDDRQDAVAARKKAEEKYGFHKNHGRKMSDA